MKFYGKVLVFTMLSLIVAFTSCKKDKQKILFIDSYHEGYEWSDGITKGIQSVITPSGIDLKIVRMDTKRNGSEDFKKEAGLKAKQAIDEYKPDLVIAADDNASKYVIVPYYKASKIPFVFCGINWDASAYGFGDNVTGMLEVAMISQLVDYLKTYAKGDRFAIITADTETERKENEYYKKIFNLNFKEYYVKDFKEFKEQFIKMQKENDFFVFGTTGGIKDWKEDEAKAFVQKNIKIPGGTTYDYIMPYSLIGLTKSPEEQGEWAAQTALKILAGASPKSIAIAKNQKGNLLVNMALAKTLKITFSKAILGNAVKVE
jgi:ABC-type uncharacterized transport system substrate-binding protein